MNFKYEMNHFLRYLETLILLVIIVFQKIMVCRPANTGVINVLWPPAGKHAVFKSIEFGIQVKLSLYAPLASVASHRILARCMIF